MGRIQSNIGLISGVPIKDTVDKLIAIQGRSRDLLVNKNKSLESEQVAVTGLTALLASLEYMTNNLGKSELYDQRTIASGDPNALAATLTGQPAKGSYQFTALQRARAEQLVSSGFTSKTAPIGAGTFSFRFGGQVEQSASLALFNGGEGISRGKIRITDRSGASAEIDLSLARSADDVLRAINEASTINVTAVTQDGGFRLIDNTGQTTSNLKVQEVAGGLTAASLGLDGIDAAANAADGRDVLRLFNEIQLDSLNDGNGVRTSQVMPDVLVTLKDGTTHTLDLSPITPGTSQVQREGTLGEVLAAINALAPEKLKAEVAPDGNRLVLTDLTSGEGTFQLSQLGDSHAADDLGLTGAAENGVITGRKLLAGTKSVLLQSLNGGAGLGPLGSIQLTDRAGTSATVDLSAAETLDDVIRAINASGAKIEARVNDARSGIQLTDTTGVSAGHLIVANGDGETKTAEKLGVAADTAEATIVGGNLKLKVVGENTKLSALNGGSGVARGNLTIVDTTGRKRTLSLAGDRLQTVGDVMTAIDNLGLGVEARINDAGDGMMLVDTAHGAGTLAVVEGYSTTAADLHLLNSATKIELGGQLTSVIDGTTMTTITLNDRDTLTDLVEKLNGARAGLTASVFNDGSSIKPFRLSLASQRQGRSGESVFDTSKAGFSLGTTVSAEDALLQLGGGTGSLVASSSNRFTDVFPGATLEIREASSTPITVTVGSTDTNLGTAVQAMVDNYNKFHDSLAKSTAYDAAQNKAEILAGDSSALRMGSELLSLLSGRFLGVGPIQALQTVGISLKDDGSLSLDQNKLKAKFAEDPDAVKKFFTDKDRGVSARFNKLLEQLAGEKNSLLTNRLGAIQHKIMDNQKRIDFMNERLESQRQRLLTDFYRMETAIGKLQNSLNAISSIAPLTPLYSTPNSK
ncbi:MAG: flagellar filament capping protein FliD [Pirellulales bacterium]